MARWRDLVERYDEVDSTMITARERARSGAPHGTSIIARSQRAGRGRQGRSWFSPPDAGLWLTVILRPGADGLPTAEAPSARALSFLSLVAGVALARATHRLGASAAKLKWPNDVVVGERKLAGILCEAEGLDTDAPSVLVGIGLNLSGAAALSLPAELVGRYVGLAEAAPGIFADAKDRERILFELLDAFEACYASWRCDGPAKILDSWRALDALRGRRVRAETSSGPVVGLADGVSDDGALRIRTPSGIELVYAGEVMHVGEDS